MASTTVLALLLVLVSSWQHALGANILGVFPIPSHSHLAVLTSLTDELAARGHQVTVILPQKSGKVTPNYREIEFEGERSGVFVNLFAMDDMPFYQQLLTIWDVGNNVCEETLTRPIIQEFIHSKNETFDLVIVESFINECFLGFAHAFNAPIVQLCSFSGPLWLSAAIGNPQNYAYMPDFLTKYNDHMTFGQRLLNTINGVGTKILRDIFFVPKQNEVTKKAFAGTGNGPVPDIYELEKNTALAIVNWDFSLGNPRPVVPNFIEAGGIHIKPRKKLPKDLQDFLDASPEGVVYFSMGSNLRSKDMDVEKRDALLKAFSKLKMKVLWKWEDDSVPGQPENVKLEKWLPQSDLLAHPNVKVFLTHGGLLSTLEAVYNGVPVVCMPVYGDQKMNTMSAVSAGYGYFLDFNQVDNEEAILEALNAVINDASYLENARRISRIFRDQPQTPMERAVFWTEYVIRHKGAPHMRSASLDLAWYQYHLLDVFAVVTGGILIALVSLALVATLCCRRLFGKKTLKRRDNKKN